MEVTAINIGDLLRNLNEKKGQEKKPRPLDEAQIMELQALFSRYTEPCPFKPGDLVTPRANANYTDRGVPHIVIEVADQPIRNFTTEDVHDIASHAFGCRLDVRVAVIADGERTVAFWQESWQLEAWPPKSAAGAL